ncbi:asparagine synthase (glutamine-hydrolyzing) [Paludisphaera borealis]|uniref:asparagine synthase (glutamine-hydrolyzing) n=1 Tax=Paludisphaera borealis TaxID=1387353 RepID=A0A1U7CR69_9BACT|nr:asparagine synthase (glutamine-hydrolyzing) [Paludisphaera borealis]APW61373.1 Asparagine synthetase [glutamine-hydrolyzing] 1 [Paludisphaera borealis]
MCGIAGFVNGQDRPADRGVIEAMTAVLARRGPDGSGVHVAGPVALGHRRLSIIDVAGGAQPLSNEDGTVWVTYNGELYNELDLRPGLEALGHRYKTRSDTETLVHLYEEKGVEFVNPLNGMFALAIWDEPRGRLVLARDRMGQKPLYYAELPGGGLAFGSEPKALLEHPQIARALDPESLARYLFYEYIPAPYSIWRGVRKLPRGHVLVWERGAVRVARYWSPPSPTPESEIAPFEQAVEPFWSAFREAVGRHRRSDVPLGVFLSGGVDSSSVAAALCEIAPAANIHTFSIGFEDPSFDESRHALEVARFLGTNHHARTFAVEQVYELLPEVAGWLDEPFGDASILPTHLLSRFARESVTVALGGDGADELMAGYPTFEAERAARLYRGLPRPARALAEAAVGRLPVDHRNFSFDFKLKQFLRGAAEPLPLAHQRWLGSFSGPELSRLLIDHDFDVEAEHVALDRALPAAADPLARSLALYQETYLPEDILTKVDRASMACGLEVRAPFLDAELVDQIVRLPSSYKYGRGRTKRLLKAAVAGRIPAAILDRPKKGFGIPAARWLRGPLGPMLDRLLGRDRLERQGLFQPDEVARRIEEHRSGARDHRKPLWTLLMFQLWHEQWLE